MSDVQVNTASCLSLLGEVTTALTYGAGTAGELDISSFTHTHVGFFFCQFQETKLFHEDVFITFCRWLDNAEDIKICDARCEKYIK